jgi:hypothetical protein
MARWLVALYLLAGCATASDTLDAHNPGDPCIDTCPEGLVCTGTMYTRRKMTYPGHCELKPGRCGASSDCARSQRCVRTSEQLGLCAEAPQL